MTPQPIDILKKYFGYDSFRAGQSEIVSAIMSGRDCLAVMPTGAGKSLCFQIPALILDGITLVVSPLISLMRDQVAALTQNGIPAAFINSSLSASQTDKALDRARRGSYKIIYVAPERLDSPSFLRFAQNADIVLVAVDEAHCVSHWGQDFRPSYLNINVFVEAMPTRPIVAAFTATATSDVKTDIARLLCLDDPFVMTTGFNRENLYFEVRRPRDKYSELLVYLREREDKSGIVYCATRKAVDEVAERLIDDGFKAARYHAGMSQSARVAAQDDFVYDRRSVIVATNAFGMGIDKSNVSFVVHYNTPSNIESYYQEAGRAGRDGSPAECALLFNAQDIIINKFLINHTDPDSPLTPDEQKAVKARDLKRLYQMVEYCKTTDCLRRHILDYFGDNTETLCDNCGNCGADLKTANITTDAQKILSCIYRLNGRYGISTVTDVLRGAATEKLINAGLDKNKSHGVMSGRSVRGIREITDFLLRRGYMATSGGEYPVVKSTSKTNAVLFGNEQVVMPVLDEPVPAGHTAKTKRAPTPTSKLTMQFRTSHDRKLFEALKVLRKKIAQEEGVPAFVVFSDATLVDMCVRKPSNDWKFLDVSGVGRVKLEKYGEMFLELINRFEDPGYEEE